MIAELLSSHKSQLLQQWVDGLVESGRISSEVFTRRGLRKELEQFLDSLAESVSQAESLDPASAAYDEVRGVLGDLSIRWARQGLSIGECLAAILSLKDYLAPRLVEQCAAQPETLVGELVPLGRLVDELSLATLEAYTREQTQLMAEAQKEAIRELSTPVLQLRESMLLLPIIGVVDSSRANQLTRQLLNAIRAYRARAVVIDITGVPTVDSAVANHFIQTVQACRLLGATVVVSGLSAEIAQTLVRIGVDLSMINTVGDLSTGIEESERFLGYQVIKMENGASGGRGAC